MKVQRTTVSVYKCHCNSVISSDDKHVYYVQLLSVQQHSRQKWFPTFFCLMHPFIMSECHSPFQDVQLKRCTLNNTGCYASETLYYSWLKHAMQIVSLMHCMGLGISAVLTF